MHTQLSLRERRKQLGLVPGAGSQPTPQFWGTPFASREGTHHCGLWKPGLPTHQIGLSFQSGVFSS